MAYSLRKHLGKRQATSDLKASVSDGKDSSDNSASSLAEDMKTKLTLTKKDGAAKDTDKDRTKDKDKEKPPIPRPGDDLSTPPPPPDRKLASRGGDRKVSPSQTLLDRYKARKATTQVATANAVSPTAASFLPLPVAGRQTSFGEDFDVEAPKTPAEGDGKGTKQQTEMHGGVEFEMLGRKKGQAGEAPIPILVGEPEQYQQRRVTRSETRRQQRADSSVSSSTNDGHKNDDADMLPECLTIRKVNNNNNGAKTRSASPKLIDIDPPTSEAEDGREEEYYTPLNSPSLTTDTDIDTGTDNTPSALLDSSSMEHMDPSLLPPVLPTTTTNFGRRKPFTGPKPPSLMPVPVLPPPYRPTIPHSRIWTSPLSACSRPTDPWGWMKRWTCCQCSHLDPHGKGRAGQTMAEQKICCRLECGHVRCAGGCTLVRDPCWEEPAVGFGTLH